MNNSNNIYQYNNTNDYTNNTEVSQELSGTPCRGPPVLGALS